MPNPGGRPSTSKLLIVSVGSLDSVVLDEHERKDGAETLGDALEPNTADSCLEALRRTLSMTYASNPPRPGEDVLRDIRRAAIATLGELGPQLELLRLPRVDADRSFEHDHSAKLFMHAFVPSKELDRRVRVEWEGGRKRPLREVMEHVPGDPVLRTLRQVLSMTFGEATTPIQHDRILEDIRFATAEALMPCNAMIEAIGLEPVAMPTKRRFVNGVDTEEGEEPDERDGERLPPASSPAPSEVSEPAPSRRRRGFRHGI